jgi:hypothetical protein
MTQDEINQVNEYLGKMRADYEAQLLPLRRMEQFQKRALTTAQQDSLKMGQAVYELWKLAKQQPPVTQEQLAQYIPMIINYYCPDFDIPF